MYYDIASLGIQTALCVYCVVFKWRTKDDPTSVVVLLIFGLSLLVANQTVIVLYGSPGTAVHHISEMLETLGFACLLLGVHVHYARQLAIEKVRHAAAEKLRSVLPENTA